MAAYKVIMSRVIAPHRYTEATGSVADHETPENELAVNERGASKEAFRVMYEGDILYSDGASLDSVSDEDKARASELLYVANQKFLNEHARLGSLKKLGAEDDSENRSAVPAASSGADNGNKRGGGRRGAASASGEDRPEGQ
jgi:hypothetical protein